MQRTFLAILATVCFTVACLDQFSPAQPPPFGSPAKDATPPDPNNVPKAEVQDRIVLGLVAALDVGVPIYNKGDHQGCYQIYRGALLAAKPMLGGMPELMLSVQERLDRAAGMQVPHKRTHELRKGIDEIRWRLRKSLWDRLGGESGVAVVVKDTMRVATKDPKVNFSRDNKYVVEGPALAAIEQKLVEFISVALGGPLKYSGRDMKTAHAGMRITDQEFSAFGEHLVITLKRFRTPQGDIDELIAAIGSTRRDIVESGGIAGGIPAPPPPAPPAPPAPMKRTLWERLGGDAEVKAIVHDFVLAGAANPKVNFSRDGRFKLDGEKVAKLETSLVEFISAATGGPWRYAGRDMKVVHTGMKITDDEFNALAIDLANALKKYSKPQADIDELMAIVGSTRKDIVGQ